MILAISALMLALWAGLLRLGWPLPRLFAPLPMAHGPLMVGGFLGTVIGLERAVALELRWAYAAPLCTGIGALLLMVSSLSWLGPLLITLGSLLLLLVTVQIMRIDVTLHTAVIMGGALCWLVGNLLWLTGQPVPSLLVWWIGFPLLTVAGERLELGRFLQLSATTTRAFVACIGVFLAGAAATTVSYGLGVRIAGAGMMLLAAWLLRHDIAYRRIKAGGQARYIAFSLLSGYVWLAVGGLLAIRYGGLTAGPMYDAMVHAIFLGFVFTMIFAHAPIIFPAVLRRSFVYSPHLYSHLILLHITLVLRMTGDLWLWMPGRIWGGLLNAVVLLLFLVNTLTSLKSARMDAAARAERSQSAAARCG